MGSGWRKPTNQAIKNIEKHLDSIFQGELKTTFNMKHKDNPGYATAAVDMMFVSSDMSVDYKSCPDVDVSDHLPLVAVLDI
jgi:endonuclease/exonuclease/phosphatase family metal-dependent hydrolase